MMCFDVTKKYMFYVLCIKISCPTQYLLLGSIIKSLLLFHRVHVAMEYGVSFEFSENKVNFKLIN